MTISRLYFSESRAVWHVLDENADCVATLELGQVWTSDSGASYRLERVHVATNRVTVHRIENGTTYSWHPYSLVNSHMTLAQ